MIAILKSRAFLYCAMVLVVVAILWIFMGPVDSTIDRANAEAMQERGRRIALQSENLKLKNSLEILAANERLLTKQKNEIAEELKRRPIPPPAKPAPHEAPALRDGLLAGGLHAGLTVVLDQSSILGTGDARRIWGWMEDANRLPGLEARTLTLEEYCAKADARADAIAAQRDNLTKQVANGDEAFASMRRESELRDLAYRDLQKRQARAKRIEKLKLLGAVVLGAAIDRGIRR